MSSLNGVFQVIEVMRTNARALVTLRLNLIEVRIDVPSDVVENVFPGDELVLGVSKP
jgi:hypothetical protein